MPQLSKLPLSKGIEEQVFSIFWQSVGRLSGPRQAEKFFYDLLSPVERTMLAKRLAIALFLEKGYGYDEIKYVLKVSSETIAKVKLWLTHAGGGYRMVISRIIRDEKMKNFWKKVDKILVKNKSSRKKVDQKLAEYRAKKKLISRLGEK